MLDPQPGTEQRMVHRGDVPGGVDVRVGGAQGGVDGDTAAARAVGEFESGGLGERGARGGADRGQHVVGRVLLPVVGAGGEDQAVLAGDLGEAGAEVEADPVLTVQLGEDLAQFGADDLVQRGRLRLDDGDLGAVAPGRRRDLQADPAGSGDHQMAVVAAERGQDVAQPVGVGEAAQMVDAGQVRARDVEAARFGTGGEQQLVVVDDGVVTELYGAGVAVDGGDGLAEVQLDVGARVPGRVLDEDAVALLLARQVPLGQGGRSYGWSRSSPMRITRPLKPSARSVSAAFAPASPPPMMTNVRCASTT